MPSDLTPAPRKIWLDHDCEGNTFMAAFDDTPEGMAEALARKAELEADDLVTNIVLIP